MADIEINITVEVSPSDDGSYYDSEVDESTIKPNQLNIVPFVLALIPFGFLTIALPIFFLLGLDTSNIASSLYDGMHMIVLWIVATLISIALIYTIIRLKRGEELSVVGKLVLGLFASSLGGLRIIISGILLFITVWNLIPFLPTITEENVMLFGAVFAFTFVASIIESATSIGKSTWIVDLVAFLLPAFIVSMMIEAKDAFPPFNDIAASSLMAMMLIVHHVLHLVFQRRNAEAELDSVIGENK